MTSLVRLRVIEIEGDADALLPLVDRLIVQDGRQPEISAPPAAAGDNGHVHHWAIDTPNGPTSTGRCSCGRTWHWAIDTPNGPTSTGRCSCGRTWRNSPSPALGERAVRAGASSPRLRLRRRRGSSGTLPRRGRP